MYKQVIIIRNDIKMGTGKKVAQGAHASLEAYEKTKKEHGRICSNWRIYGAKKVVLKASLEEILDLADKIPRKIPYVIIKDAGHTQVEPGTITAMGIGPWEEEELDKVTGQLKLL